MDDTLTVPDTVAVILIPPEALDIILFDFALVNVAYSVEIDEKEEVTEDFKEPLLVALALGDFENFAEGVAEVL